MRNLIISGVIIEFDSANTVEGKYGKVSWINIHNENQFAQHILSVYSNLTLNNQG